MLLPTMPAPMTTTFARSGSPLIPILAPPWPVSCDKRHEDTRCRRPARRDTRLDPAARPGPILGRSEAYAAS